MTFLGALPFASLMGAAFFRERMSLSLLGALGLAVAGSALIFPPEFDFLSGGSRGYGEGLAVISAAGGGLGLLLRRWHSPGLKDNVIAMHLSFMGAAQLMLLSLANGEGLPQVSSPQVLAVLLASALLVALASVLVNYGCACVPGTVAGVVLVAEALFAVPIGLLFYGEAPSAAVIVGGLAILAGVALATIGAHGPPLFVVNELRRNLDFHAKRLLDRTAVRSPL